MLSEIELNIPIRFKKMMSSNYENLRTLDFHHSRKIKAKYMEEKLIIALYKLPFDQNQWM